MTVEDQTAPDRRAAFAPPPRTLVEIFAETASRFPDEVAIDDGDEVLT